MNDSTAHPDDLQELLIGVIDGKATAEQINRLSGVLCDDPVARRRYLLHMMIHARLQKKQIAVPLPVSGFQEDAAFHSSPFITTLPDASGFFASGWPVAYLIATVIFGIGLLIGSHVYVSEPEQVARRSVSPSSPLFPLPSIVGRITGLVDCKWADRATEASNGAHVPLGRKYSLASGLMEITYDTGAKVILQGPVTYEMEANGGYLSVGKLTGKLDREGGERGTGDEASLHPSSFILHPFVIRTPTATVIDLGTEFGVTVSRDCITQVHVLRGAVDARIVGPHGDTPRHQYVTAGRAIEIGRQDKNIKLVTFVPQSFVRTMRPVADVPARTAYMKAILGDNPIGYWRLGETGSTTALDSANAPGPPHCGAQNGTVGAGVILGGTPGAIAGDADKAATFDGNGCISIADGEPFNFDIGHPFTIEAWFRTDAKIQFMGIVSKGAHLPDAVKTAPGYFLGVGRYGPGESFGPYVQLEGGGIMYRCAGGGLNDGKWHHLVARYSGAPGLDSLTLFVDGRKIATEQTVSRGEGKIDMQNQAPLRIGYIESEEPFVGAIDEVVVYGWALEDASIVRHFQVGSGRPSPAADLPAHLNRTTERH